MIIKKMALPRRTFLRGMGVTMALPLLDAMFPALTSMAAAAVLLAGLNRVMSPVPPTIPTCGQALRVV